MDENSRFAEDRQTVAQYFAKQAPLNYSEHEELLRHAFDAITKNHLLWSCANGRFKRKDDPTRAYRHWRELLECCCEVVDNIAELPYAGAKTHAAIMGNAMVLLRERYGLNVPNQWVIIMRNLRSGK